MWPTPAAALEGPTSPPAECRGHAGARRASARAARDRRRNRAPASTSSFDGAGCRTAETGAGSFREVFRACRTFDVRLPSAWILKTRTNQPTTCAPSAAPGAADAPVHGEERTLAGPLPDPDAYHPSERGAPQLRAGEDAANRSPQARITAVVVRGTEDHHARSQKNRAATRHRQEFLHRARQALRVR